MCQSAYKGNGRDAPHVVLIFPPVWVPMVPHLAIPTLSAYLRQKGLLVTPMDANVTFFTEHLLTPETLGSFVSTARGVLEGTNGPELPPAWRELLKKELPMWEASVSKVDHIFSIFRQKREFLDPDLVLPAQDQLLGLLHLCSIARWPGQITFNHYRREDIGTVQDLLELCDDPERNIFLPFWRDHILPKIHHASPTAVGISISSVHQFIAAMTLARLIRMRLPHVHVVVGGKHLLNLRQNLLDDPFVYQTFFHSAILFEGERPLERLVHALQAGAPLHGVPNLVFLDGERPVTTALTDPLSLEMLPHPDFDEIPWDKYLVPVRYAPIRMAEGCYWGKCTFCARYGPERTVFIPPERVLDEIEYLGDVHDVRDISVNDDCLPPSYWEEISEGIIKRRLSLSMLIWAKPVAGFTRRRLQKMARAGVRQIRWGVESAQPRVLRLMQKGTTVDSTLRVLQDAHDAGIWNHACFILGFPTETRKEAQVTLEFLKANSSIIQSFILYPFALYENSYVCRHPEEFGIHDLRMEATPLSDRIFYTTKRGMSRREARALVLKAKELLLDRTYHWPFWYYLKLREYLQLYLDHYGLQGVLKMSFSWNGLRRLSSQKPDTF